MGQQRPQRCPEHPWSRYEFQVYPPEFDPAIAEDERLATSESFDQRAGVVCLLRHRHRRFDPLADSMGANVGL
ncbi:hypothetical protein ACIBG0_22825 [Nocardia sp. NPDC050630]|uniref:hypothetical protein n=1 Tax=Nocardia sp. NPDC050630 TaxID=3364321 RepID=UPI003798F9D4